jgi:preprotein translocase subunit SecA
MAGPFLDPLNPQSKYAGKLLDLVARLVLSDPLYVARLERHYDLVKQAASDPKHPAYRRLQEVLEKDERDFPTPAPWKKRVGRNDPCPCGSGRKYKHCCGRKRR